MVKKLVAGFQKSSAGKRSHPWLDMEPGQWGRGDARDELHSLGDKMIRRCFGTFAIFLGIAFSGLSIAQSPPYTVEVIPNNPTTESPITVRIGVARCFIFVTSLTYPTPNTIRIDLVPAGCPGGEPGLLTVSIGLLPVGTYAVEVFQSNAPAGSATFSVGAALSAGTVPIPTMADSMLLVLAAVLAVVGVLLGKGRNGLPVLVAVTIACAFIAPIGLSREAVAASVGGELRAGNFVPNRIIIRFKRALLDPSPAEIRGVNESPTTSALATTLGNPRTIRRLIGREPTPFEADLARRFPRTPEARLIQYFVVDYSTTEQASAARISLSNDSRFEHVARDPIGDPAGVPVNELYLGEPDSQLQKGQYQWGFHALGFEAAFDKYTGSARIGVADTGIGHDPANPSSNEYHSDLRQNFRPHLSKNFTDPLNLPDNARLPDNIWDERYRQQQDLSLLGPFAGHGTHVSGLITADWKEGSTGIVGGCPNCSLLVGKFATSSASSISSAISHLIDVGAQVINLSYELGVAQCVPAQTAGYEVLCDVLSKVRAADVVFVAAAGNSRAASMAGLFPVDQPGVIAVGGLESDMTFWEGASQVQVVENVPGNAPATTLNFPPQDFGSNRGPSLRLVAPATEVLSTFAPNHAWVVFRRTTTDNRESWSGLDEPFTYADPILGNVTIATGPPPPPPPPAPQTPSVGWGTMTGTSQAAPHVSAIAGLVRTVSPLRPAHSLESLMVSSRSGTTPPYEGLSYSIPDARGAVDTALGNPLAINRRTPMFAFWSSNRKEHFYSTSPQEANAALRGTLWPPYPEAVLPTGSQTDFASTGNALYFYDRFPQILCQGTTPCNFSANLSLPRALFEVWTGYRNPYGNDQSLVRPLYRLSKSVTVGGKQYGVTRIWWTVDKHDPGGASKCLCEGMPVELWRNMSS